jgi:wobble nucleotide-excising tRNase
MLERIKILQGIGLLHDTTGLAHKLERLTLLYSENGRGKTTLAAVLRSLAAADPKPILGYRTIDGTRAPKAVLQFEGGRTAVFENGAWTGQEHHILVFDTEFIARNVHSGGLVNTENRKNLLEFALGEGAVAARNAVQHATEAASAANEQERKVAGELANLQNGITPAEFDALPQIPGVDKQIAELEAKITAAKNIAAITARALPQSIAEPSLDIDALFSALAESLPSVHAKAEELLRNQLAKLGTKDAEGWISQGVNMAKGNLCPYCDQDVATNQLVLAYQAHFDAAYRGLKGRIAALQATISAATDPGVVEQLAGKADVAAAQATAWAEQVPIQRIRFDADARNSLAQLRHLASALLQQKSAAPAEPVGTQEQKQQAARLWATVLLTFRGTNAAINAANTAIVAYRNGLKTATIADLERTLDRTRTAKRRYEPDAQRLLADLQAARRAAQQADAAKETAREGLNVLMQSTLAQYQASTNEVLRKFGAGFQIEGVGANYLGSAPRSEYGLLLRDKPVHLEGASPSFTTALSEGDKRTLAFAFFIARALNDTNLGRKIVVIDDPMCSLDKNRRHATLTLIQNIREKARQLIILAHDAYFLRDLRDAARKKDKHAPIALLRLSATPADYTAIQPLDLDAECASEYVRGHRTLSDFAAGGGGDPRSVAKTIRPVLEGYLHRRFPSLLAKGLMFGSMVAAIRDASPPSPLVHAKNLEQELNEINDYAKDFHHDAPQAPVPAELKGYVERALFLIHKGAPR